MHHEGLKELTSSTATLQKIVSLVATIGFIAYLAWSFNTGAEGEVIFYQIAAALAGVVYLLTFMDVILGLAFLIACIGLSPEISLVGLHDLRLEDFVVPALLLAWMTRASYARETLAPLQIKGPLLAYFAAIMMATLVGLAADTTPSERAFLTLAKHVEYFAIFLLIINNVRTEGEFRALVTFSIMIAMMAALLGAGRAADDGSARLHGPEGETANIFGGYLTLHVAVAVGLFLHSTNIPARASASVAILVIGTALLFTYSRTSYGALFLAVAIFGLIKNRRLLLIVLLVSVLFPLLAPEAVQERMATMTPLATGGPGPSSWISRILAWDDVFRKVFDSSPLLGFGLGSVRLGDVDSEYVRILSDTGLVGVLLFAWILLRLLLRANASYAALPPSGFARGYAAGYLIALVAMTIHAFAATSFTAIRTMECFMLLTGFAICLANRRVEWGLDLPASLPELSPAQDAPTPAVR